MSEKYTGIKFSVKLLSGNKELEKAKELLKWCNAFYKMGIASPEGKIAGNISCRTKRGFLITPSGQDFSRLTEKELVEVIEVSEKNQTVKAIGEMKPSSEAFLHAGIYGARKDVNAILHGHNSIVTKHAKEFGLVETIKEQPYGTIELKNEVLKVLGKNKLVQMKNHGFIAMGSSLEEAGRIAVALHKKALAWIERHGY